MHDSKCDIYKFCLSYTSLYYCYVYYFIVITIWIYYNTLFSSSKKSYEILRK